MENKSLAKQNIELRRRLEEDQGSYKRKLQAYQEGQQRQAQLVQKLQAKVLQYKKKCGEQEQQLLEKSTELEHQQLAVRGGVAGQGKPTGPGGGGCLSCTVFAAGASCPVHRTPCSVCELWRQSSISLSG
ncbi:hypothetical protein Chor_008272 [Crotalus horridus]